MYEHELPQHLKDSPRHPTCELCPDALGFESDVEFSLVYHLFLINSCPLSLCIALRNDAR